MTGAKNRAAGTAPNNYQLSESYQKLAAKSSEGLKEQIGVLLLYLHTDDNLTRRRTCWQFFEFLLAQYLTVKGGAQ